MNLITMLEAAGNTPYAENLIEFNHALNTYANAVRTQVIIKRATKKNNDAVLDAHLAILQKYNDILTRLQKLEAPNSRESIGQRYWETLSYDQRKSLIEAHGGFSEKHASQPYSSLTGSLKEIANEAAISPGGIIPIERCFELEILDRNAYKNHPPVGKYPWAGQR